MVMITQVHLKYYVALWFNWYLLYYFYVGFMCQAVE